MPSTAWQSPFPGWGRATAYLRPARPGTNPSRPPGSGSLSPHGVNIRRNRLWRQACLAWRGCDDRISRNLLHRSASSIALGIAPACTSCGCMVVLLLLKPAMRHCVFPGGRSEVALNYRKPAQAASETCFHPPFSCPRATQFQPDAPPWSCYDSLLSSV